MPSIFPESPDYDDKNGAQNGAKKSASHDNRFELTMGSGDAAPSSTDRLRIKALQAAEGVVREAPMGERADRWLKLLRDEFGSSVDALTSLPPMNDRGDQFHAAWQTAVFHDQPTARLKLWFGQAAAPRLEKGAPVAIVHINTKNALLFDGTDLASSANYASVVPEFHETFTQLAMAGPEALKSWAQRSARQKISANLAISPAVAPMRVHGAPALTA